MLRTYGEMEVHFLLLILGIECALNHVLKSRCTSAIFIRVELQEAFGEVAVMHGLEQRSYDVLTCV